MRRKANAMTDHEKRVNMGEINNFLSGSSVTTAKLPGMLSQNFTVGNLNAKRDTSPYQFERPVNMTELKIGAAGNVRSRSTTPYQNFKSQVQERNQSPLMPAGTFHRNAARILS
jgi:hypothetical protein